ncbi:MAG: efflux RND transporter periplasmic adaptor subunit, partial [Nitrospirota bacterium]|nr:efflux RND transporter periplasmic adaptor subunit [Nitrospirota bacterium]
MISQIKPFLLPAVGVILWACSQTQEPGSSSPAMSSKNVSSEAAPQAAGQIETAVVDFKPVQPELVLVGKVAYGEDRYSRISS